MPKLYTWFLFVYRTIFKKILWLQNAGKMRYIEIYATYKKNKKSEQSHTV